MVLLKLFAIASLLLSPGPAALLLELRVVLQLLVAARTDDNHVGIACVPGKTVPRGGRRLVRGLRRHGRRDLDGDVVVEVRNVVRDGILQVVVDTEVSEELNFEVGMITTETAELANQVET